MNTVYSTQSSTPIISFALRPEVSVCVTITTSSTLRHHFPLPTSAGVDRHSEKMKSVLYHPSGVVLQQSCLPYIAHSPPKITFILIELYSGKESHPCSQIIPRRVAESLRASSQNYPSLTSRLRVLAWVDAVMGRVPASVGEREAVTLCASLLDRARCQWSLCQREGTRREEVKLGLIGHRVSQLVLICRMQLWGPSLSNFNGSVKGGIFVSDVLNVYDVTEASTFRGCKSVFACLVICMHP